MDPFKRGQVTDSFYCIYNAYLQSRHILYISILLYISFFLVHHHLWFLLAVAFNHTGAVVIGQPSTPTISLAVKLTFVKLTFRFAPYKLNSLMSMCAEPIFN